MLNSSDNIVVAANIIMEVQGELYTEISILKNLFSPSPERSMYKNSSYITVIKIS